MNKSLFIIAGEPSGDYLGAELMHALHNISKHTLNVQGIGGPLMAKAGLQSLFPMDELSVMGFYDIALRYPLLRTRLQQTVDSIVRLQPAILITIDSPEFCLRVAKNVKHIDPRIYTLHYVAPAVWASRPGRAKKIAQFIDHIFTVFPFEPPYFQSVGIKCDFIGHQITTLRIPQNKDLTAFKSRYNISNSVTTILVLLGSRINEVKRLVPIFERTLKRVIKAKPNIQIVVPMAEHVSDYIKKHTALWQEWTQHAPIFLDLKHLPPDDKWQAFKSADIALAASGSVSLELARMETPMVIAYDIGWLSRSVAKSMLTIDTITLINIITGTKAIPEYYFDKCQPKAIAQEVLNILDTPEKAKEQIQAMRSAMKQLNKTESSHPSENAARIVLDLI